MHHPPSTCPSHIATSTLDKSSLCLSLWVVKLAFLIESAYTPCPHLTVFNHFNGHFAPATKHLQYMINWVSSSCLITV